jgi:peptide/nickel transport system permease protein
VAHYIVRRSLQSLVALAGLFVFVFFLVRLTGDPADVLLPTGTPPEVRQEFTERYGFDQPIYIQFARYMGDILQGDFGTSLRQQRPAMDAALEAFPTTLQLAFVAIVVSTTLALVIGALAASRAGGVFDRLASLGSLAGASAPDFWIAIVGILVFSVALGLLPTSGTGTLLHWIMPITVLMLRPFGLLVQVVRGSMISVLSSPYVKTARAKGTPERSVIFVHALRNALLPVITVAGDLAASLMNGAVIVESVYGWPGIGKLMLDGIVQRDFAVVQATVLVTAMGIFILNIVIDITYALVDPRIRYS